VATAEPSDTLYVLRTLPWSEVIDLGRRGVAAYALDIPTPDDFERTDDPPTRVFVPVG
jgi:hypothetical protein